MKIFIFKTKLKDINTDLLVSAENILFKSGSLWNVEYKLYAVCLFRYLPDSKFGIVSLNSHLWKIMKLSFVLVLFVCSKFFIDFILLLVPWVTESHTTQIQYMKRKENHPI